MPRVAIPPTSEAGHPEIGTTVPDIRIGFILSQQFTLLAFAGLIEALRHAADEADRSRQIFCRWSIIGDVGKTLHASCGIPVAPTEPLGDPSRFDYIAIVGGRMDAFSQHPPKTFQFLRDAHDEGNALIGLCTGSFALAEAGLLDGKSCAVHWRHEAEMNQRYPMVRAVTGKSYIINERLITCPGGVASISLAAALVEKHCGRTRALKSLAQMSAEPESTKSFQLPDLFADVLNSGDRHVERAIKLMRENPSEPKSVQDIADKIGASVRQLDRAFQRHTRMSPGHFWRRMRLEHARSLLTCSNRSVTEIAYDCGFADAAHLSRWFKETYGETPRAYRTSRTIVTES